MMMMMMMMMMMIIIIIIIITMENTKDVSKLVMISIIKWENGKMYK